METDVSKNQEAANAAEAGAGCLIVIITIIGGAAVYGWAGMWMWSWFMTPFGLPDISLLHAIGVSLVVRLLVGTKSRDSDLDDKGFLYQAVIAFGTAIMSPLFILGLGWCVKSMM